MICYHHNDLDGKAAAHCVHTYKPKTIPDSPDSYIQCTYEDKMDKHTEKDDVFIVDLSISPSTYSAFLEVCKTARTVTWIDHHKSSIDIIDAHKDELQSISNLTYFVSDCACGAALTYAYFKFPQDKLQHIRQIGKDEFYEILATYDKGNIEMTAHRRNKNDPIDHTWSNARIVLPNWLRHIDDYDCWKGIYVDTEFFTLGCDSCNTGFTVYNRNEGRKVFNKFWNDIMNDNIISNNIRAGKIIHKYIHSRYHRELRYTFEWTYGNTTFICKNATGNSWNFEHYISKYPAVILFFYDGSCGKWKYSVYSDEKSNFNCKEFCEQFGGGGHEHAAGFSTDKLLFLHTNEIVNQNKLNNRVIFLGGTCNDDPWREEFIDSWKKMASNLPETKSIELFNPVVEDWTKEAEEKENKIKADAFINLFVITPNMKGVYSIAEAVECAIKNSNNKKTIFAIYDKHSKFDKANIRSFDATGDIITRHGGIYIYLDGENAMSNLVELVISNV